MREPTIQSYAKSSNGNREKSYWLCQWNTVRYSDILNDPNFKDPKRQIKTCRNKYKLLDTPWTIFHWWYARKQHYKEFII